MSKRYAPSALAMNGGSPPTAPNARAGLFTPPGMTRLARTKASWLWGSWKRGVEVAGVVGFMVRLVSSLIGRARGPRWLESDQRFYPVSHLETALTAWLRSRAGGRLGPGLHPAGPRTTQHPD